MKNRNVSKRLGALVTGTLITGSLVGSTAQASELIGFEDLGSGAELRADLLASPTTGFKSPEAKCGEGKCGEKSGESESKASEHKCGEGKCGEGKCGEKSGDAEVKSSNANSSEPAKAPSTSKKNMNSGKEKKTETPK